MKLIALDFSLGTPSHALLLASSVGHSRFMLPAIEDFTQINAGLMTGQGTAKFAPTWSILKLITAARYFPPAQLPGAAACRTIDMTTTFPELLQMCSIDF